MSKIDIPKGKHLRVVSKISNFRRGGLAHGDTPVTHDPAEMEEAQIAAILAEPKLIADWVDAPKPEAAPATKPAPAK